MVGDVSIGQSRKVRLPIMSQTGRGETGDERNANSFAGIKRIRFRTYSHRTPNLRFCQTFARLCRAKVIVENPWKYKLALSKSKPRTLTKPYRLGFRFVSCRRKRSGLGRGRGGRVVARNDRLFPKTFARSCMFPFANNQIFFFFFFFFLYVVWTLRAVGEPSVRLRLFWHAKWRRRGRVVSGGRTKIEETEKNSRIFRVAPAALPLPPFHSLRSDFNHYERSRRATIVTECARVANWIPKFVTGSVKKWEARRTNARICYDQTSIPSGQNCKTPCETTSGIVFILLLLLLYFYFILLLFFIIIFVVNNATLCSFN